MRTRRLVAVVLAVALASFVDPAMAHASGLGSQDAGDAPFWFVMVTGGGVVGGSFLFATLLTDHEAIRMVNAWRLRVPVDGRLRRAVVALAGLASVAALAGILYVAFAGPANGQSNAAVLVVWAGWWAGYTISVYLLADTWPLVDPWRRIAGLLPRFDRRYPERFGSWPAVAGLLGLVWLEVVSPVSENPRLLGVVVAGYTVVTLAGAVVFGPDAWFGHVDPIAHAFRFFGRIAPVQRTDDGLAVGLPASTLAHPSEPARDETAFIVALLWATTYDGLVSTGPWALAAEFLVGVGVPPLLLYLGLLVTGYALFRFVYRVASARARESAESLVSPGYVARWFAPALLPIAAGYHVAHFLGYFLQLSEQLLRTVSAPLTTTTISLVSLPGWFSSLQLVFVVAGHLFAIWVAHALSFELFPGRLQPIRSQYPFTFVMIFYTMTSMWIIAQPYTPPPYV
ncbi:hypothetical protein BRC81_08810 [Halobacteriales archaeon QS_1_68_20]|nr:MAG: hypothetical protein BRC81_08810 [Halobacteriales archaeon QS_1_68_20]